MKILARLIAMAAVFIGLTNCVSVIKVEKFTGKENGVRYSLPATYLLVTPKSDGSANYEWVYLPDPNNEYAVRTISFMSKYTTDITLDNTLLKKVTAKSDTGSVAAKMFDTTQSVYSARTAALTEATKKEADKNAAAQKAIADAKLELELARAELSVLEASGKKSPDEAWIKAKTKVEQAEKKVAAAEAAARRSLAAMNVPGGSQAWGPTLFRVVQTADDVSLVAVNIQQRFDTVLAVTQPTAITTRVVSFSGPSVINMPTSGPLQFDVVADSTLDRVDSKESRLIKENHFYRESKIALTLKADKKTVHIEINPSPSRGKYTMTLPYSNKPGEEIKSDTEIKFEVQ